MKRVLAIFLSLVMIVMSFNLPVYANENDNPFNDTKGHWAEELLTKKYNRGFIKGYPDGTYRPDDNLTRAELITLLNRNFGLNLNKVNNFDDVKEEDWFVNEANKASYYEYVKDKDKELQGYNKSKRIDAIMMLGNLLEVEKLTKVNKFEDMSNLSQAEKDVINSFAKLGYISGDGLGHIKANENLTRAEILTLVDNVLGYVVLKQEDVKNIPENAKVSVIGQNITLDEVNIKDLYISPGVCEGLKIKNSNIDNIVIASDGSKKEAICIEGSNIKKILIEKRAKDIELKLVSKTKVREIIVDYDAEIGADNSVDIDTVKIFDGEVTLHNLNIDDDLILEGGEVVLEKVKVNDLIIDGESVVDADSDSNIKDLYAKSECEIKGKGKIYKANIEADDVDISIQPKYTEVEKGVEAKIDGKKVTSKNDHPRKTSSSSSSNNKPNFVSQGTKVSLIDGKWEIDAENGIATGLWAVEDLNKIGREKGLEGWELSDTYVLMKDIDFKNKNCYRTGKVDIDLISGLGFKPIGDIENMEFDIQQTPPFIGKFDGNNKVIRNLYINRHSFDESSPEKGGITVGFFGGIVNGKVENVNIKNANIKGVNRIGVLAAAIANSEIINCSVTGKAEGNGTPENAGDENYVGKTTSTGGLIGTTYGNNKLIEDCWADVDISGTDVGGGLIGYNYGSKINRCYALGDVEANNFVGGFAGVNVGTMKFMPPPAKKLKSVITCCYSTGNVKGKFDVGGFVGYNHVFTDIENCYSLGNVNDDYNYGEHIGGFIGHDNMSDGKINMPGGQPSIVIDGEGNIKNCYCMGNVRGIESTGGFIGERYLNSKSIICNNISFVRYVISDEECTRFLNTGCFSGSNNYAYGDMLLNGSLVLDGELGNRDGKDIFKSTFGNIDTYKENGLEGLKEWDFDDVWKMGEDRPVLIGVGDDKGKVDSEYKLKLDLNAPEFTCNIENEAVNVSRDIEIDMEYNEVLYKTDGTLVKKDDLKNIIIIKDDVENCEYDVDIDEDDKLIKIENLEKLKEEHVYYIVIKPVMDYRDNTSNEIQIKFTTGKEPLMEGVGTKSNPFMVANLECLVAVGTGEVMNDGKDYSKDSHYKVKQGASFDIEKDISYKDPSSKDILDIDDDGDTDELLKVVLKAEQDGDKGFKPLSLDGGSFDGNEVVIDTNLMIINREDEDNVGLFSEINNTTLKNIVFKNTKITGIKNVGSLVGTVKNDCLIDNCNIANLPVSKSENLGGVIGCIEGDDNVITKVKVIMFNNFEMDVDNVGGLVGNTSESQNSVIKNCEILDITEEDQESNNIGGMVGNNNCTINNCYIFFSSQGELSNVGGIAGKNTGKIINNIVKVYLTFESNSSNIGYIVGDVSDGCTLNNYYISNGKINASKHIMEEGLDTKDGLGILESNVQISEDNWNSGIRKSEFISNIDNWNTEDDDGEIWDFDDIWYYEKCEKSPQILDDLYD